MEDNDRIGALEFIDPARGRPAYWDELRERIVAGAAMELARRRRAARASVASVLSGWSRSLIPAAVAAATIAALLMAAQAGRKPDPAQQLVLRDVLGEASADGSFEALLSTASGGGGGEAAFMTLVERGGR